MLLARRGIRQGLFCRFDTVSPWRQLKGYRVSYDRRRRLSPAAGIIKLKSHCVPRHYAAAQQSTLLLSFRETLPVSWPRVTTRALVAYSSLPVLRATRSPRKSEISRRMTSRYATIKRVSSASNRDFIVPFIADDIRNSYLSNIIFKEKYRGLSVSTL